MLYLDLLSQDLRDLGYTHLSLPVLAMADVLSRDVLSNRPLNSMLHLKSMEASQELNLPSAAHFHEKMAEVKLNEEDQAKSVASDFYLELVWGICSKMCHGHRSMFDVSFWFYSYLFDVKCMWKKWITPYCGDSDSDSLMA